MTHVFVDESCRSSYLLVATYARSADLQAIRADLRRLCRPGQRRIHFAKESDRCRKAVLSALSTAATCSRIYQANGPQELARAAALTELVAQLPEVHAQQLVLESRGHRDNADRQVIYGALQKVGFEVAYRHVEPQQEPMLWISDAIAWAYGAGGDWTRRVRPMIQQVTDVR